MNLEGAHLLGEDAVPARSEMRFHQGVLTCETRTRGPMALALLWPVEGYGRVMLETSRLIERAEPYHLHVELARGRLMRISQKREDWGLFDFPDADALCREVESARDRFVEALSAADAVVAARLADEAIRAAVPVGERLGIFHADVFLKRRRGGSPLGKRLLGCGVPARLDFEALAPRIAPGFDFVDVSMPWKVLEPRQGSRQWGAVESILKIAKRHRIAVRGTQVLCFEPAALPPWTRSFEQDADELRAHVIEHLKAVLSQFGAQVAAWEIVSGLHAYNGFGLQFEQIMDLTRLAATAVKQLAPRSSAIIGITLPWGEYYARDQRTIPPLLYADMVVRNGVNFDAFALEIRFGGVDGVFYARDLMQISAMLDRFGNFGRSLHVTLADIPPRFAPGGAAGDVALAGWIADFSRIALSKPFVDSVSFQNLVDGGTAAPENGLLRADLSPKPAFEQLQLLRRELAGGKSPGGVAPRNSAGR